MTRYYIFSNPGSKEKYTEVSAADFIAIVRNSKSRFYISFGNAVMECTKNEFVKYRKEDRHKRYIKEMNEEYAPVLVSFEELPMSVVEKISAPEDDSENEEKAVRAFWKYVSTLSEEKQAVLKLYYGTKLSQEEIAIRLGRTQQSVSYICRSALSKFNKDRIF